MSMTPREIVQELDKHIVGQSAAKRAVAIALRNRWRRMQVTESLRSEITPKNILMIGPTGVGKTEIARRLARLARAPFVKVEATKFTEVGYVGREVDSIIKDLMDVAVKVTREEEMEKVRHRAMDAAEERVLDVLLPRPKSMGFVSEPEPAPRDAETRQKFRKMLREGQLDEREIEIEVRALPMGVEIMAPAGMEDLTQQLQSMFSNLGGTRTRTRKVKVREAFKLLTDEEAAKMINEEELKLRALDQRRAERHRVHRRDRQDRAPPGNARRRRFARGRAARPAAAGRGQHRQHQVRHGEDRSHPVHRLRRVPHVEALGPDSRAAGPLSDPRRARRAQGRGFHPHPDRAGRVAVHAVPRAARDRRREARVRRERRAPHRRSRMPGERAHREHRRAAPAHGARAPARSAVVRSGRSQRLQHHRRCRSTSTSTSASW